MLATLAISLREYLEVFLIIGVFLGISKKLDLKREKEIIIASLIGVFISLLLPLAVFITGEKAKVIFSEKNSDLLAGYLMVFSGCFIAYVIFSLHNLFVYKRSKSIIDAHQKLQKNIFDLSLFFTIIFFILREGMEVALFTATSSLFSSFMQNIFGLLIGFSISAVLGSLTFFAFVKFSINKVFRVTEYIIILLGASFVANGLSALSEAYLHLSLSAILPLPMNFLPDHDTIIGGFLKTMIGLERDFSIGKLAVMGIYIGMIYLIFLKKRLSRQKVESTT